MRTIDPIHAIAARRWRVALTLSALMLVIYFGFILLVAFGKPLLSVLLIPGLSLGILLGALVIVSGWILSIDLRAVGQPRLRRGRRPGHRRSHEPVRGGNHERSVRTLSPSCSSSSSSRLTLGITYWAARRTKTTEHFYAAGRRVTGFQNGLALAGDYMSAASFLGIAGLVALSGFDGLIYSIGWLVGWPIIMFLIAEPLRNLGKYTFADVVAFRLRQTPVRIAAAIGTLAVVLTLSDRADGRRRQPDQAAVRTAITSWRSSSSAW